MKTITRDDVVKTIRSFRKNMVACDRSILKMIKMIDHLEKSRANAEKIMAATFRPTWKMDRAGTKTSVLRDVSDIYAASLESSDREIRELYNSVERLTQRKERMCRIWTRFVELPEREARILSLLYENRPEKETYAYKLERVSAETGYSRSHIARLAKRGIAEILEACAESETK